MIHFHSNVRGDVNTKNNIFKNMNVKNLSTLILKQFKVEFKQFKVKKECSKILQKSSLVSSADEFVVFQISSLP